MRERAPRMWHCGTHKGAPPFLNRSAVGPASRRSTRYICSQVASLTWLQVVRPSARFAKSL
jgi:hypothetical protein